LLNIAENYDQLAHQAERISLAGLDDPETPT